MATAGSGDERQRYVDELGFLPGRYARFVRHDVTAAVDYDTARAVAEVVENVCRTVADGRLPVGDAGAPAYPDDVVERVVAAIAAEYDVEGARRTGDWRCTAPGHPGDRHPYRPDCVLEPRWRRPDGTPPMTRATWYDLRALPMAAKRALVERVWRIWQEWRRTHPDDLPVIDQLPPTPAPVAGAWPLHGDWEYGIG
jgi:hypothetical protein